MADTLPQQTSNGRRADIDPTGNVKALVAAMAQSQSDLRTADNKYYDAMMASMKETALLRTENEDRVGKLREEYQEKIAKAEAGRLDSIRQVDREEVAKTAVSANTAITTLAKQTSDLQQTLAKQVTDTAAAQETRNSAQYTDVNKRLSALELTSSEGKGKQSVADPQLVQSMEDIRALLVAQNKTSGKSEGINMAWVVALGMVTMLSLFVGIGAVIYEVTRPSVAPIIYVQPQRTPATLAPDPWQKQ